MLDAIINKLFPQSPYIILFSIVVGALAHSTYNFQQARKKSERYGILDFCVSSFLCMFSGNVSYHVGISLGYSDSLLISFTSLGAFAGVLGITKLYDKVMGRIQ